MAKPSPKEPPRDARPPVQIEPFMTISQAAFLLNVSIPTVYRLIRTGQLPAVQVGATKKIRPAAIDEYLDR